MRLSNSRLTDGVIVVVGVALVAFYAAAAGGNFPLDDSWIHQTYGRNLGWYGEWSFLRGTPSAASTSPLYTVLLAVGYAANVPFRFWAHGAGASALIIAALTGVRLARHWQGRVGAESVGTADRQGRVSAGSQSLTLITGLAVVGSWHLVWAGASGMETMLFGTFTLILIWLAWRELDERLQTTRAVMIRGAVFGVVAGLTTLTRPEGVLLVGMVGLALLVTRPNMTWRTIILWGGTAAVCFLIVLSPYLIYNLRLTGGLLPNTAAAKRAESASYFERDLLWRIQNVTLPLLAGGQLLLIPGMVAFAAALARIMRFGRWREAVLYALLPAWGVALILLYAITLPLEYQHGRYVIPALPALITAGVLGMAWLLRVTRASLIGRVVTRVLAISAASLFAVFLFGLGLRAYVQDVAIINEEMVATALWIADNIPPEELLVTHDIGAVGYFAPRPILDIAGLVSPEVIPLIGDPAALWDLMQERDAKYLMALDNQVPGGLDDPRLCEVFNTHGQAARGGGPGASNMKVYALTWNAESEC